MTTRVWIIRRNCSLSPRQLILAYMVLSTLSLLVASLFALYGAWYVLAFSVLEMLALACAFVVCGRHANDHECIALENNRLLIEVVQAEEVRQCTLDSRWTRVTPPASGRELICLEANGIKIEVGRFLTEWKRREFVRELQSALASERQTEFQF
jgi:uncharacterized membrane protein